MIVKTALMCLALNIYHEARDQPIQGQISVAEVTLNRVASKHYPDNICSVVFQRTKKTCQFSWTCGNNIKPYEKNAWEKSQGLAELMLDSDGHPSVLGKRVTHYHANYVKPYWAASLIRVAQVGDHIFYE